MYKVQSNKILTLSILKWVKTDENGRKIQFFSKFCLKMSIFLPRFSKFKKNSLFMWIISIMRDSWMRRNSLVWVADLGCLILTARLLVVYFAGVITGLGDVHLLKPTDECIVLVAICWLVHCRSPPPPAGGTVTVWCYHSYACGPRLVLVGRLFCRPFCPVADLNAGRSYLHSSAAWWTVGDSFHLEPSPLSLPKKNWTGRGCCASSDGLTPRHLWPSSRMNVLLCMYVMCKGLVKIYRVPGPGPSTGGRRLFIEKK